MGAAVAERVRKSSDGLRNVQRVMQAQTDPDAACRLIAGSERFIWSRIRKVVGDPDSAALAARGIDRDDLYQAGCIGLWNAIRRFDPSRNVRPTTFAASQIDGELHHLLNTSSVAGLTPRHSKEAPPPAAVLFSEVIATDGDGADIEMFSAVADPQAESEGSADFPVLRALAEVPEPDLRAALYRYLIIGLRAAEARRGVSWYRFKKACQAAARHLGIVP